jgi:hypothetical protein
VDECRTRFAHYPQFEGKWLARSCGGNYFEKSREIIQNSGHFCRASFL